MMKLIRKSYTITKIIVKIKVISQFIGIPPHEANNAINGNYKYLITVHVSFIQTRR